MGHINKAENLSHTVQPAGSSTDQSVSLLDGLVGLILFYAQQLVCFFYILQLFSGHSWCLDLSESFMQLWLPDNDSQQF